MTLRELFDHFTDLFDIVEVTDVKMKTPTTNYYYIMQIVEDKMLTHHKKIYLEDNYNAILEEFGDFIVEDWAYRAHTNAIAVIITEEYER